MQTFEQQQIDDDARIAIFTEMIAESLDTELLPNCGLEHLNADERNHLVSRLVDLLRRIHWHAREIGRREGRTGKMLTEADLPPNSKRRDS